MRGALNKSRMKTGERRIIPADAGSTLYAFAVDWYSEDHPRGCGEHRPWRDGHALVLGSSPRMRGALSTNTNEFLEERIIPADAGSTAPSIASDAGRPDHPRGCGEHVGGLHRARLGEGSSPRMRGAPFGSASIGVFKGIIPADAGSTPWRCSRPASPRDHPRGCGEHRRNSVSPSSHWGSSPRMRGAPLRDSQRPLILRIIPADAGSTSRSCRLRPACWDHPRGCGEH